MAFNLLENAGARPPKKIEKREKLKKLESQIPRFVLKPKLWASSFGFKTLSLGFWNQNPKLRVLVSKL